LKWEKKDVGGRKKSLTKEIKQARKRKISPDSKKIPNQQQNEKGRKKTLPLTKPFGGNVKKTSPRENQLKREKNEKQNRKRWLKKRKQGQTLTG